MISETELLAHFEGDRPTGPGRWQVKCPAHADTNPSLQVTRTEDRWLLKCFAGCPTGEVIAAAELEWKDLFAEDRARSEITDTYDYTDESGELLFQVCRKAPKDFFQRRPDGHGDWVWKLGDTRRVPYRLPKVAAAVAAGGTVFVVEGERDVHAIEQMGGTATTNPGGAGKWRPEYAEALKGAAQVVVVPDDDPPGHEHARDIVASLNGIPVQVVLAAEGKDPADHLAAGYGLDDFRETDLAAGDFTEGTEEEEPFALTLDQFIADTREAPEPLVGTTDDCIIPALGFALLIAKGGKGKTTFCIELALHLASGTHYLGLEVPRPLNILFIENEGPREPFRRKLERKRENWPHELKGEVFVYDQNWGHARLDTPEFVERLNGFCAEREVELVVGDPLDSLGMEGEGSPSETRAMVDRFKDAGLFTVRAWLVPHHSRKESVQDAVDEAAGAWGGRPDAMLALEKRKENTARLSFAKVRWQGQERNPYILDFDPEAETFTFVKEEEGEERDYAVEAEEFLAKTPLKTSREVAEAINASREKVEESLKAHPDRFDFITGDAAKDAGRKPNAVLWLLASPQKPAEPADDFRGPS